MNLTEKNIDHLYQFTRQHFVEYYDLQTELVDHLANGIELQWQHNSKLIFDEALNLEFKKFGVFGFMDVVEKRQQAMTKRYNKLVWKHFKEFFAFPKIIMTVALILSLYLLLKNILVNNILISVMILSLLLYSFFNMINNRRKANKKAITDEKRWLFKEIINNYGSFIFFFALPLQISIQIPETAYENNFILFGLSILTVIYCLATYIVLKIIPSKIEKYLKEVYPEYEISK